MKDFKIGSRRIGPGEPVFFLAEIGLNHNGDLDLAESMINSAARTGAEGVKFQTYRAETLADPVKNPELFKIFKGCELGRDDHFKLREICDRVGLYFISTPFDEDSVDLLIECDVPAFKVASGDLTNIPLLEKIGSISRPVIMSTGMGFMDEIVAAIKTLKKSGVHNILPLHCVSSYPPDESEINLKSIVSMRDSLGCPVGFSDHYVGSLAVLGAAMLGAVLIEKHFTLNKNLPGPDQRLSADEGELRTIIEQTRLLEKMIGSGIKQPSAMERSNRSSGRRGVYAAVNIPRGVVITKNHLKLARPEGDMPAWRMNDVLGCRTKCAVPEGTSVSEKYLEKIQPANCPVEC